MLQIADPRQQVLFDPFAGVISPAGWKRIADGWQGLFREVILQLLPVAQLGQLLTTENTAATGE